MRATCRFFCPCHFEKLEGCPVYGRAAPDRPAAGSVWRGGNGGGDTPLNAPIMGHRPRFHSTRVADLSWVRPRGGAVNLPSVASRQNEGAGNRPIERYQLKAVALRQREKVGGGGSGGGTTPLRPFGSGKIVRQELVSPSEGINHTPKHFRCLLHRDTPKRTLRRDSDEAQFRDGGGEQPCHAVLFSWLLATFSG
jgi:hypothetical protein